VINKCICHNDEKYISNRYPEAARRPPCGADKGPFTHTLRWAALDCAVQCCAALCCLFSVGQVHEYVLLLLFNTTLKKRAMLSQGNRAMPL